MAWIEDWYLREGTRARALAAVVELQGRIPLVAQWGSGRTSSSDGQAFPIGFKNSVIAQYGGDPVSLIYTPVSDRYAPFHANAINSTVRDATHVLDGLLHHDPDPQIEEHYADTSDYTDHIFALRHLLGFRFAPRIRDLGDHRRFSFEKPSSYGGLRPLVGGRIHVATIRKHWDEVARFVTSIGQGSASTSLLVAKLAAYRRQTHLASAGFESPVQISGVPECRLTTSLTSHRSGGNNIAITGTYQWKGTESTWGRFRPRRLSALDQFAAHSA